MTPDDAAALGVDRGRVSWTGDPGSADVAVSLGGDGTMLRTVNLLGGAATPIIGVNLGLLGYLTEVDPEELIPSLERWSAGPGAGRWELDDRMMLEVSVRRATGDLACTYTALNEAVIEKLESGHTIRMLVTIDGKIGRAHV